MMGKVMQWNGKTGKKSKYIEVEDSNCLYEKEVKEMLGKQDWKDFEYFILGQTCPKMSDNSSGYYKWDVERFIDLNVVKDDLEVTGTVGGRTNTRKWGSKREDKKNDQHNKKKKWQTHDGLKRTKLRWNKKRGKREVSKKGSRDIIAWAD